jgi:hypothetical protein
VRINPEVLRCWVNEGGVNQFPGRNRSDTSPDNRQDVLSKIRE